MLEKILVPVDGSELSDRIVTQLRRLLVARDASVALVQVLPPGPARDAKSGTALLDAARDHLAEVAKPLADGGATVTTEVLVGDPAERVLAFAREWKPSLVALATHGRTGIARWIRGSTAERILRTSPFPLLLANPSGLGAKDELRVRKILVALDGSQRSGEILPLVAEVAKLYEAQVTLLYVIELVVAEQDVAASVTPVMTQTEAHELVEPFRRALGTPGAQIKTVLGLPAQAILDEAERGKYDLVALTTHGRTGLARWAFGSVAENVLRHAPCPLLVQRTAAGTEDRRD